MSDPAELPSTRTLLAAIRQQYLDDRGELKCITVPEWESNVYYYERPNYGEFLEIAEHCDLRSGEVDLEALLVIFRIFARNADGTPAFREREHADLRAYGDPQVINRVVNQMGVLERMMDAPAKK